MNSSLSGFSNGVRPIDCTPLKPEPPMFVFNRNALAVLAPLAMLACVVWLSA
jgi:hypothetical protein